MKNKTTIYHLILDRSSSMSDCRTETIAGFNTQLNTIKELQDTYSNQKFLVSLTIFNHQVNHLISNKLINKIKSLNLETYHPRGTTALLDAIGESINIIDNKFAEQIEAKQVSVVVVVLTDGYENASVNYGYQNISSLIKEKEYSDQWTFSFIGADINAMHAARNLNIREENIISFNKKNMSYIMNEVNESMRDYADKKSQGITKKDLLDIIKNKDQR
jgi:uncharacterized protein YegL